MRFYAQKFTSNSRPCPKANKQFQAFKLKEPISSSIHEFRVFMPSIDIMYKALLDICVQNGNSLESNNNRWLFVTPSLYRA